MSNVMGYGNSGKRRRGGGNIEPVQISPVAEKSLDAAATSGKNKLEIVIDGQAVLFELYTIKHKDIESTSYVSDCNIRDQKIINKLSLQGLIKELENGQLSPAISYIDEQGKFEVMNGSQRRYGCFHKGMDFITWGTTTKISNEAKANISKSSNYVKPNSLYERGESWLAMQTKGKKIAEIAKEEDVDRKIIRAGIAVRQFPDFIIDVIPSTPDLGRPLIESLAPIVLLDDSVFTTKLKDYCVSLKDTVLSLRNTAEQPSSANKLIASKLFDFHKQYFEDQKSKIENPTAQTPVVVKQKLDDGSQVKIKHDSSKKSLNLTISEIPNERLSELKVMLGKWGIEFD